MDSIRERMQRLEALVNRGEWREDPLFTSTYRTMRRRVGILIDAIDLRGGGRRLSLPASPSIAKIHLHSKPCRINITATIRLISLPRYYATVYIH